MNSAQKIREYINEINPSGEIVQELRTLLKKKKILIACSGGADSIALVLICYAHNFDFGIAYVEHGISPETAECEIIVKQLANDYHVPFYTAYLNMTKEYNYTSNIEALARRYRYDALERLRSAHGYDLIATAHHEDDYVETFFINLLRGSGSKVSSLQQRTGDVVRPILNWRKSDLIRLVNACRYEYFEDPMNASDRYVRNRIRNEVIPLLDEIAVRDTTPLIARAARHISADNEYLDDLASSFWPPKDSISGEDQPTTASLKLLDRVLQVHALRTWIKGYPPSDEELLRILDVVEHKITSTQLAGGRTIWRSCGILYQDRTNDYLAQR